jgi:hypothetical protein
MTSTPKRQKNRDGSYTPTSLENSDWSLKRKGEQNSAKNEDIDDPLLAAYNNPYLAHMLPDQAYVPQIAAARGPLRDFKRRQTTAKQAEKAEEGPDNPFTLRPLSQNYFSILKKRRELPVHDQRHLTMISLLMFLGKSFLIYIILHRSSCSLERQGRGKPLRFLNSSFTTN